MTATANMNGLWSGWYGYHVAADARVRFTAWFDDQAGRLKGSIVEENTFADPSLEELSAELAGVRDGLELFFTKLYLPAPGAHGEPIRYEGVANEDLTAVSGAWRFDRPSLLSGAFALWRASNSVSSAVERTCEALVE